MCSTSHSTCKNRCELLSVKCSNVIYTWYRYYSATNAAVFCSYCELFANTFKPRIAIIVLYMEDTAKICRDSYWTNRDSDITHSEISSNLMMNSKITLFGMS